MGITPKFTKQDIKNAIKKKVDAYHRAVEARLKFTGETFLRIAREDGAYSDRTGNLRSSLFFKVLYNGKVLSDGFEAATGGDEGLKEAKKIANKIARDYPKGFALVCGAGMNYAAAVESIGKDVITGSSQKIEKLLKSALERINGKVSG
ncbi:hypothetical protein [Pedobacter jejuensis]|uniref:Uncharacterized protein n=1 Tax=Pedobacter jejuensis TaxID=1268550 RepID=A0A3N0BPF7_9SPHI|nr:hypothetical protein [Pedobacter jejuensis]RNL50770.1 hypothetical protein D7004_17940 [Pedobacter jejuensis]